MCIHLGLHKPHFETKISSCLTQCFIWNMHVFSGRIIGQPFFLFVCLLSVYSLQIHWRKYFEDLNHYNYINKTVQKQILLFCIQMNFTFAYLSKLTWLKAWNFWQVFSLLFSVYIFVPNSVRLKCPIFRTKIKLSNDSYDIKIYNV